MSYYLLLISGLVLNTGLFSKDLYIPSLPTIAKVMHIPYSSVSASITLFIIGTGISQLVFGPLSDSLGRKKALLLGLGMCILGNYVSIYTKTIFPFLCARFFVGLGAGATAVVTRAIASDLYKDEILTKAIGNLSIVTVISSTIAPFLGGWLQDHFNWQANFITLTALSAFTFFIFLFSIPETIFEKQTLQFNFLPFLKNKEFIIFSSLSIIILVPSVIYTMVSPYIFQNTLGLSAAKNGFLYLYLSLGYFLGALTSARATVFLGLNNVIKISFLLCLIGGLLMAGSAFILGPTINFMVGAMFFHAIGCGLITPIANKNAITALPSLFGTGAALLGALRMLGIFIFTFIATKLNLYNQINLGISFVVFAIIGLMLIKQLKYI